MHEDPIVAETRKLRGEMMSELGDDLDALVAHLKQREQTHPDRLVNFPPRRPVAIGSQKK
jgi:hypothetical protein